MITSHLPAVHVEMEQVIADLAGTVLNSVQNRKDHPTYGNTKTKIRTEGDRLEGAISMYMVVTGQAFHAGAPNRVIQFQSSDVAERVNAARDAVVSI